MSVDPPDPYSVSCPTCKARKKKLCVYLWPKDSYGEPRVRHRLDSPETVAKMDRAGTPTVRPHTERYAKARAKAKADALDAQEATRREADRPREAVLRAHADALREEHEQLIAWLRANARILMVA